MFARLCAVLGGLFGASGVSLAASAAHLDASDAVGASAQMALGHAGPLLAAAAIAGRGATPLAFRIAVLTTALGAAMFCAALSARVFLEFYGLPMAAPIGGVLMIVGWVLIALTAPLLWRRTGGGAGE